MFAEATAGCTFILELDIYYYWNRFLEEYYLIIFYEVVSLLFLGNTSIPISEGGDCRFKNLREKPGTWLIVSGNISFALDNVLTPVSN